MANVGLPGTSGFVGEILTMTGVYQVSTWAAFGAASGVILSAVYALTLYRRVVFGEVTNPQLRGIADVTKLEIAIFVPLILGTLWLGVYPAAVFDITTASVDQLVQTYQAAIGG
jgi:NADH-quinone oxidoreductase subunit M